ncbi:hypothetical protein [Nonomuraea sp. NPDC049784]|uniref:hypothetical protein n=1 Tax=Nonomuraea sp. NPDC049784 TaxID=3154361 RepID=UPI00340CFA92
MAGGVLDDCQRIQARSGQGANFEEVTTQQGDCLAAEKVGPGGVLPLGRGVDAVVFEYLPDRGGGDLDVERGQLAVDAPVAPCGVLPCQSQHQDADGPHGAWASAPPGYAGGRVTAPQQIAVPAQDGVRPNQQRQVAQLGDRQTVKQPGEKEPVIRCERGLGQLPLQHPQLMPQHQYLDVFVMIAPRQEP